MNSIQFFLNKARHNVKPTHSYEPARLKELMPDNLKLFMVYFNDEPSAVVNVLRIKMLRYVSNMLRYDYAEYKPIQRVMTKF